MTASARLRAADRRQGKGFALPGRAAAVVAASNERACSMNHIRPQAASLAVLVAAALAAVAPAAQARNVRLMESVPDTAARTRVHDILGDLVMQFGGASAQGASIVRRDVVVKGVGDTKIKDVGEDDKVRPTDHDLCARAFEDAVTQFAFAARGAKATAILGVISNYEGTTFDDPTHYECHVGALKAAVTLRGQLAVGAVVAPIASPPQPAVPVISPPPQPTVPVISPPPADAPPPAPTFQPLPPRPNN